MCLQVKTIIFDKTGTLTHGKPVVTTVMMFVSEAICSSRLFTALVGVAETNSEHPLGAAVVNYAKSVSETCSLSQNTDTRAHRHACQGFF